MTSANHNQGRARENALIFRQSKQAARDKKPRQNTRQSCQFEPRIVLINRCNQCQQIAHEETDEAPPQRRKLRLIIGRRKCQHQRGEGCRAQGDRLRKIIARDGPKTGQFPGRNRAHQQQNGERHQFKKRIESAGGKEAGGCWLRANWRTCGHARSLFEVA